MWEVAPCWLMTAAALASWLRAAEAGRSAVPLALERLLSLAQLCYLVWAYAKRRPALRPSARPRRDRVAGVCGTAALFLFDFGARSPAAVLAPVLQPLTTLAIAVRVGCVLSLGRSFGIAAADRGVVTTGAYRLVRHPMYAAYTLSSVLQLGLHASAWNAAVVASSCGLHAWRIRCEEELLERSPAYRTYRASVRWRMVPGVW